LSIQATANITEKEADKMHYR